MEFRTVKEFCKHAGPGVLCPDNYNHCNADNCPLAINSIIDEQECDRDCPIVDKYRADVRQFKTDYFNANDARKQLEKDIKRLGEAYTERADQYSIMQNELLSIVENSVTLITSALYDLRDKLKESCKRLEP